MGDYFKGWRRKVGVVTLLMALMFMGGWLRSIGVIEEFICPCGKQSLVYLVSCNGIFFCGRDFDNTPDNFPQKPDWFILREPEIESSLNTFDWSWRFFSIGFGNRKNGALTIDSGFVITIPYWSVVIPLTLISAYLLLSKPRQSTQQKIVEPIPTEGT